MSADDATLVLTFSREDAGLLERYLTWSLNKWPVFPEDEPVAEFGRDVLNDVRDWLNIAARQARAQASEGETA